MKIENLKNTFRLYPEYDKPILSNFESIFDTVFIAINPFFRIKDVDFKKKPSNSEGLKDVNGGILDTYFRTYMPFPQRDEDYPSEKEILENAEIVSVFTLMKEANLSNLSELVKALSTRIGKYRKAFERKDLRNKLTTFCENSSVFIPDEGSYSLLSKKQICKICKNFESFDIYTVSEHYDYERDLQLDEFAENDRVKQLNWKDYFIYLKSINIFFAIDWDSHFFLICGDKNTVKDVIIIGEFEGFYCDKDTTHNWEYTIDEINHILKIEEQGKL
jgi:Protein of unknown function (DUF2711)